MLVNNEIHHGETVEEKISLSGRFGLWVAFHPFNQEQYLRVTRQWAEKLCAKQCVETLWTKEAREEAIQWAYMKGDNSGRIAYQFACRWVGNQLLNKNV